MIKVSIVIPMYNVQEYLNQCLNSAVRQSLKDIEIICVNDGSTDGTLDIVKKFERKDSRVRVFDKTNSGYGHTMNLGISEAVGEYIVILESDDYIDVNMCEELYNIAKSNDLDFIKADFNRFVIGRDGKLKLDFERIAQKFDGYYNKVLDPSDEKIVFRFRMNTWSGMYSREFIEEFSINHNESPGASYQDNGFFFKTFCNAKRVMFKDKAYYMNRRDNLNSSVHNKEKVYCMSDEYDYIEKYLKSNNLWEEFKGVYFLKRLHSEHFTYNRIAEEFRADFLGFLSIKYREVLESGENVKSHMTDNEYELYRKIAYNPSEFVAENKLIIVRRTDTKFKKVLRSIKKHGLRKTILKIIKTTKK